MRAAPISTYAKVAPGTPIPEPGHTSHSPSGADARTVAEVLRIAFKDYRKRTVMLVNFQVLQTVAYYGFGTLAPLVLVSKGFEVTESLGYAALTFGLHPDSAPA